MTGPNPGESATHSVVIHGHFYQPPRDDPWSGLVEREPSAAPDHDWTARIERECYAPLAGVRAASPADAVGNLFAALSFNVGANLCEWLERSAPDTYAAILGADRRSARRFAGHGNAIAMPYDHIIMPLASRRDKVTEVRWGMADFTRRFGRAPEGMWLPETAVDEETLDVLASEGIRFTILAPHQIENPPDDGLPIAFATSGDRSIALFTYDGPAAGEIAFGALLSDPTGGALAARLAPAAHGAPAPTEGGDSVTAIATDGETFGHHHRLGVQALAGAIARLRANHAIRVENFAAILARQPPRRAGRIRADTSWSCPHGIERWRSNCACHVGPVTPEGHRWRAPLRAALNGLATRLHETFEQEGARFFEDPWGVRNGYGAVVAKDGSPLAEYVAARLRPTERAAADPATLIRARELLELERSALRMFTSDGWFFDSIDGIEARLLLLSAAHALGLAGAPGAREAFLEQLAGADHSGAPAIPLVPDPAEAQRRALHAAAAGIVRVRTITPQLRATRIGQHDVSALADDPEGAVRLEHRRTGRTDRLVVGDEVSELPEREAAFLDLAQQIGVGPVPRAPV